LVVPGLHGRTVQSSDQRANHVEVAWIAADNQTVRAQIRADAERNQRRSFRRRRSQGKHGPGDALCRRCATGRCVGRDDLIGCRASATAARKSTATGKAATAATGESATTTAKSTTAAE